MMNKKTTFYLVFVTLLALLLNVGISLHFLNTEFLSFQMNNERIIFFIVLFACISTTVSFVFSKVIARYVLGITLIRQPATYLEKWLFNSVERQSRQLGIKMPQIGIFYASGLNAFTTGWGQRYAMFALSSGLLQDLDEDELEAIIGHELAHIANGDMVALAISRSLVFSLSELPARFFGMLIDALIFRHSSQGGIAYTMVYWFCMLLMGIIPHFIVMWFSRQREFFADKTSVILNGEDKMISALQRLLENKQRPILLKQFSAFGMSSSVLEELTGDIGNIINIFSSHPPINKRIHVIKNHLKIIE